MSVIPITVFLSLGLVFIFVALFWREHRRRRFASAERDSLLPLAEETPRLVLPARPPAAPGPAHGATRHPGHAGASGHRHGDGPCACERGERAPCAACRHSAAPAL